jgi:hypothetical protein
MRATEPQPNIYLLTENRKQAQLDAKLDIACADCGEVFQSKRHANEHADKSGHAPYQCGAPDCDSQFTREDSLRRHMTLHEDRVLRYPCPHCKKYKGINGFKRKDHLMQHMRGYHHIEDRGRRISSPWSLDLVSECLACDRKIYSFDSVGYFYAHAEDEAHKDSARESLSRGLSAFHYFKACYFEGCPKCAKDSFKTQSEYTTHLKKDHGTSLFSCEEPGCDRRGGKGYTRKRDLKKHQEKMHPNTETSAEDVQ